MSKWVYAAFAAITALLCAAPNAIAQPAAQLSDIHFDTISVRVDKTHADFTVIDSRMDETATAAVFFGLIGAAVNSADNNSEDARKADPLRATAASIDLSALILQSVNQRLGERPEDIHLADPTAHAANTLVIELGEWGLIRRAQKPDTSMRAFLKMNISILDARGHTVWGPQREHSIGQLNAELSAFTPDVFRAEMQALAATAGRQVANRLIYR